MVSAIHCFMSFPIAHCSCVEDIDGRRRRRRRWRWWRNISVLLRTWSHNGYGYAVKDNSRMRGEDSEGVDK
jgi:hypothetical protein